MSGGGERLGSAAFRAAHGLRLAYVAGSMVKGIASVALVRRAAGAGCLAFFGAGGLRPAEVAAAVDALNEDPGPAAPWGVNFLHNMLIPAQEDELVDLLLAKGVSRVEASAFIQLTPALLRYRVSGLEATPEGAVRARHRVMAKVSHPEVARRFLLPPPPAMLDRLLAEGRISRAQARLAAAVPVADDVCVEADSGGHTDKRVSLALFPAIAALRAEVARGFPPAATVRLGLAGGLGAPEAVAAAFVLGAEFVLTGSINQCTPEAGTSDLVKDMLAAADIGDFDMAPAGDMFEIGARVQVLRRGTLFAARGNRLLELYHRHGALEEIDPAVRRDLEAQVFGRPLAAVWEETEAFYRRAAPAELAAAAANPKKRMAMVFRWYFVHSNRLAMAGDPAGRANFQVHAGPALGACNRWLAGTPLADWRARHVDRLARGLMAGAEQVLERRLRALLARDGREVTAPSRRDNAPAGTSRFGGIYFDPAGRVD